VLAADLTKGLFIPSAHVPLLPIAKGESLQGEGKFYIQPPLKGRLEGRPSCYNEPLGGDSRADRKGRGFPSLLSFQGRLHHNEGTGEGERIYAKVTADDGTEGWGEAGPVRSWSYETPKSALSTIENYLGPAIVGMDPFGLASIHEVMDREIAPAFNIGQPVAKSAIDICKRLGIREFFRAEKANRVELIWMVSARDAAEAERIVAEGLERGHREFKVKIGVYGEEADIEILKAVRRTAGEEAFIWADANQGYTLSTALRQMDGDEKACRGASHPYRLGRGDLLAQGVGGGHILSGREGGGDKGVEGRGAVVRQADGGVGLECRDRSFGERPYGEQAWVFGQRSTFRGIRLKVACGLERPSVHGGRRCGGGVREDRRGGALLPEGPGLGAVRIDPKKFRAYLVGR